MKQSFTKYSLAKATDNTVEEETIILMFIPVLRRLSLINALEFSLI
jgi:hypothetical protein